MLIRGFEKFIQDYPSHFVLLTNIHTQTHAHTIVEEVEDMYSKGAILKGGKIK